MKTTKASAEWQGAVRDGKGTIKLPSGNYESSYSYASRFEQGKGTNPEEMLGASHAACYSMALTADLNRAGFQPKSVKTEATVYLDVVGGVPGISKIELRTEADVPGLDEAAFQEQAEAAKKNCPISRALAAVNIELTAKLTNS